ncbi:acetylglutamate kinase [Gulosibacter sp. 10]|uniref:acetylglutamate kinase n=1 Tax=Gulosibacter sp. 10 TaxID=1255570 RepID=UPI00097F1D5E|nr:acetylglutamate kinase [Gulosibacter sp. 10]SJM70325.1 Acetylglutamate kinase [Gulosibacter sp. 10]
MSDPSEVSADPRFAASTAKVETLIEALPWMQRYNDQIVVVKFGGNAMVDPELIEAFASDIAFLRYAGVHPVVVHGGGPHISRMLDKLGIESEFRAGYRYTSEEAIEVVRMVLGGQVARELVSAINDLAPVATGTSGEDAGLFQAKRKTTDASGNPVDLGHVGEIVAVNPNVVRADIAAGRIPVVSTIASDVDQPRKALNINADRAAAALAVALGAKKLVMLTDVEGLYRNWPDRDSLASSITADELRQMLGTLESGMIPKAQACLEAIDGGVKHATIIDGRVPHSTLIEIFTTDGFGTEVVE